MFNFDGGKKNELNEKDKKNTLEQVFRHRQLYISQSLQIEGNYFIIEKKVIDR